MRRPGTAITITVIAFVGLCVTLLTGLVYTGKDIGPLVTSILAIIAPTIGVILLGSKVDGIQSATDEQTETLGKVERAVNGNLEKQFQALHDHIWSVTGVDKPESVSTEENPNA